MVDKGAAPINLEPTLVDIAIEGWRLAKVFGRVLTKMDAGEGGGGTSTNIATT